jgi:hypothetical protein
MRRILTLAVLVFVAVAASVAALPRDWHRRRQLRHHHRIPKPGVRSGAAPESVHSAAFTAGSTWTI